MADNFRTQSSEPTSANPEGFGPEEDRPGKKTTLGGRIFGFLFGLPFLGVGLLFMFVGGFFPLAEALKAKTWEETPCRIERCEVDASGDKNNGKIRLVYSYSHGGTRYTATEPDFARRGISYDRKFAQEFVARHPANRDDRCRVNPKNPAESTLEATIPGLCCFIIPFSSVFVLIGAGVSGASLGLFKKRPRGFSKKSAVTGFNSPSHGKSRTPGVIGGLIFFSVGAAGCISLGILPALKAHDSANWIKTPCRILSSSVGSHSASKGGTTYSVDIEYSYTYQEKQYTSDDYEFVVGSSSGYEDKADTVRKYPAGSDRECFVNPKNPAEAVLTRELTWVTWFFGFGFSGIFMLVGGALAYAGATGRMNSGNSRPKLTAGPDGRIVLKPETGPAAIFLGITFAAIFWNGIVSVFVTQAVKSFGPGRSPEWFLCVFMIPFVLIGLGLIVGVFVCFAKLFSPRILLETDRLPAPGGKFSLRWRVSGDHGRITSLKILLEGAEEATCNRKNAKGGDSQRTEKRAFRRLLIADIKGPLSESGTVTLVLPADLPPTLLLEHNAIRWRVLVRGAVNGRMNIASEHPVEINAAANPFAQ